MRRQTELNHTHSRIVVGLLSFAIVSTACGGPAAQRPEEDPGPPDAPPEAQPAQPSPLLEAPSSAYLPDPAGVAVGGYVDGMGFGGDTPGFAWWMSDNHRLVALYRFDTEPEFGPHGASLPRPPTLNMFDLQTGAVITYDSIVPDPRGRYVVATDGASLLLIPASEGLSGKEDLRRKRASAEGDENPCMPMRQVAFDPLGQRLAWVRRNPDRMVVRELSDDGEWQLSSGQGLLWRVEPDALLGWATMREVVRDTDDDGRLTFPVQETTCPCIWCPRFATTYGFSGFSGDEFESYLAGPDGERFVISEPSVPLSNGHVGVVETREIRTSEGEQLPLPEGCRGASFAHGSPRALLSCGDQSRLFDPGAPVAEEEPRPRRRRRGRRRGRQAPAREPAQTPPSVPLARRVQADPISLSAIDDEGHHWIAVLAGTRGETRMARLRMEDGRLEVGLPATEMAPPHHSGWALFRTPDGVAILHVGSGRVRLLPMDNVEELGALAVRIEERRWMVISPEEGRAYETNRLPAFVGTDGCTVSARSTDGPLERGPWRIRCPER